MLRKALFQIHSWAGIGVGLYVLVVSVTGSLLVFRQEYYGYFRPGSVIAPRPGERMSVNDLTAAAKRLYPGHQVTRVIQRRRGTQGADVYLERDGRQLHRLFDPYTGEDLGDGDPRATQIFERVVDLHDNLLGGRRGRLVNGVGALCLTLLCLSGAVIWWQGGKTWYRGLLLRWNVNWKRFNWDTQRGGRLESRFHFHVGDLRCVPGVSGAVQSSRRLLRAAPRRWGDPHG